ncbi:hypothetical protein GCM10023347_45100 [Streptomyces chumphonensis]|uniref:Acyl carrier protein n=1 Tax=Streptomyces chumphonensis TaxID=1214925 RepID=A0A927IAT8_9ACTN|nr:acyl carrier protein [Streptomyces chumphonensis]MBD3932113.1 acyl carrier protein [Streptomyces chumphonensis]
MSFEDQTPATAASATAPAAVVAELVLELADVLQVKPEQIDPGQPFRALGVGSVPAVQFVSLVNRRYGTAIRASALFEYSTPLAFAGLVVREAEGREEDADADQVAAEEVGALLDAVREDRLSVDEALTRLPQRA